jgi:hypothetical protein
MLAFLAAGCRHSESDDLPAAVASPEGTVHLERLGEAERVLEQIDGQEAWGFKHRGGLLTTEFTVFHRPQGKDQAERVIFRRSGDNVARNHKAPLREAGEVERQDEEGGYVSGFSDEQRKRCSEHLKALLKDNRLEIEFARAEVQARLVDVMQECAQR